MLIIFLFSQTSSIFFKNISSLILIYDDISQKNINVLFK